MDVWHDEGDAQAALAAIAAAVDADLAARLADLHTPRPVQARQEPADPRRLAIGGA